MAVEKLHIDRFLEMAKLHPILDVRSPAEFEHAHIPSAISFPLFSNEERKIVGTAYKQQSREMAIKIGLDLFGPKMRSMVETAEQLQSKTLLIHCWRGGMRSAAIAWLLDLYGFRIYTLIGGYKKYRQWVIDTYSKTYPFKVLGGYTGSGKTHVLAALRKAGEEVIDLEALANHKGSAFGNIGMPRQPGQEMFENLLARDLSLISERKELPNAIWIEDESQRIGDINLPQSFWNNMRKSPVYFLDIPFEERLEHIVVEYGSLDKERMKNAITRIQKRLGPLETKLSLQHLEENQTREAFRILLKYYDKWYTRGLYNRENLSSLLKTIPCKKVDFAENAETVLQTITEYDYPGAKH